MRFVKSYMEILIKITWKSIYLVPICLIKTPNNSIMKQTIFFHTDFLFAFLGLSLFLYVRKTSIKNTHLPSAGDIFMYSLDLGAVRK